MLDFSPNSVERASGNSPLNTFLIFRMASAKEITKISVHDFPGAIVVGEGMYVSLSSCWLPVALRRWHSRKYAELCAKSNCAAPGGCKGVKHHQVFRLRESQENPPVPPPSPAPPVLGGTQHAEQFGKWLQDFNAAPEY